MGVKIAVTGEIADFLNGCEADGLAEPTVRHYKCSLMKFERYCGAKGIKSSSITSAEANLFVADLLKEKKSSRTISTYIRTLNAYLQFLVDRGLRNELDGQFEYCPQLIDETLPSEIKCFLLYCQKKDLASTTIELHKLLLLKFKKFCDGLSIGIATIAGPKVDMFTTSLIGEGLRDQTVREYIIVINTFLRFLVVDGQRDVCLGLAAPFHRHVANVEEKILLSEVKEYLAVCESRNLARRSIDGYRTVLRGAAEFCEEKGIDFTAISPAEANMFSLMLLNRGLARDTVITRIRALNTFLRFLITKGIRVKGGRLPKTLKEIKKPFKLSGPTSAAIPMLLSRVDSHGDSRDKAIFHSVFDVGLRASELCALSINDIEVNSGDRSLENRDGVVSNGMRIRIRSESFSRIVQVPDRAAVAIQKYLVARQMIFCKTDHLFASVRGTSIGHAGIYKRISYMLKVTDSFENGPRALRHACFRQHFDNDTDIFEIRKLSGCKKLSTNEKYRPVKVIPIALIYKMAFPRA